MLGTSIQVRTGIRIAPKPNDTREAGFWSLTDREAERFRQYLLKGGFAIFDDFDGEQWNNFEAQMRRVLPEGRFVK